MKIKKHLGVCAAAVVAAGVLGGTVYGINKQPSAEATERITLGAEDEGISFGDVTASQESTEAMEETASGEIEEIPAQTDEAVESLPNIKKVAQDVMPAIVAITNVGEENIEFFGREFRQDTESSGSGIIVAKSDTELLIATNNHVVEGAEDLTVCFSVDMDDPDEEEDKLVPAQVKGTDSSLDLAVIAVKLEDIKAEVADKIGIVQLGDSDEVEVGEWAVAIGNALGYGQSVTFGIISALDREVTVSTENGTVTNNMIQTDAAINFGNSGGALLDMQGRLIGINSAKAAETGVEGMGYAIPINTAKPIIEDLMNQTTRTIVDEDKAGALGIVPVDVSEEARQIYNIPAGAFVYELTENSAAEAAGIKQGDIITKLDKSGISSKSELLKKMQYYEAGETVDVTVKRAGADGYEEKVIPVTLGKKSELPDYSDNSYDNDQQNDEEQYEDSEDDDRQHQYGDGKYNYGLEDIFGYFGY